MEHKEALESLEFKKKIPAGWRLAKMGEIFRKSDKFFSISNQWLMSDSLFAIGKKIEDGWCPVIKRISKSKIKIKSPKIDKHAATLKEIKDTLDSIKSNLNTPKLNNIYNLPLSIKQLKFLWHFLNKMPDINLNHYQSLNNNFNLEYAKKEINSFGFGGSNIWSKINTLLKKNNIDVNKD